MHLFYPLFLLQSNHLNLLQLFLVDYFYVLLFLAVRPAASFTSVGLSATIEIEHLIPQDWCRRREIPLLTLTFHISLGYFLNGSILSDDCFVEIHLGFHVFQVQT